MVYPIKRLAQLAAREAENPKILGSILDFDRFLGSIPAFDHFLPKKSVARERSCQRLVFYFEHACYFRNVCYF